MNGGSDSSVNTAVPPDLYYGRGHRLQDGGRSEYEKSNTYHIQNLQRIQQDTHSDTSPCRQGCRCLRSYKAESHRGLKKINVISPEYLWQCSSTWHHCSLIHAQTYWSDTITVSIRPPCFTRQLFSIRTQLCSVMHVYWSLNSPPVLLKALFYLNTAVFLIKTDWPKFTV